MSENSIEKTVLTSIAEFLGVTEEDVVLEDSLRDDLRMNTGAITDYLERLKEMGLKTENIDMGNIDTIGELIDELTLETDL